MVGGIELTLRRCGRRTLNTRMRLLHVVPLPPPWTGIGTSVQQLLCSRNLVQPARITHMVVVESVQIVACVENDKRIVKMSRRPRRLPHLGALSGYCGGSARGWLPGPGHDRCPRRPRRR